VQMARKMQNKQDSMGSQFLVQRERFAAPQ